jgi:hypothetical protein
VSPIDTCAGGIIFSGESVLAIRDGRKAQTRRVLKPQPANCGPGVYADLYNRDPKHWAFWLPDNRMTEPRTWIPRYQVGKRYYVKEAVQWNAVQGRAYFCADGRPSVIDNWSPKWRERLPAMFLPRGAYRYLIEIINARVERLQDITDVGAVDEGIRCGDDKWHKGRDGEAYMRDSHGWYAGQSSVRYNRPVHAFAAAWDAINRKRAPWVNNPWIWAYAFKLVAE